MNILLEKKLSYADKNNLSNDDFGLPDVRKFPLIDEKHVLSAIQYFRYCEISKRPELAKNINKKLQKYDMKVNISEDNPFYKYIDKRHLDSVKKVTEHNITINFGNPIIDKYIGDVLSESINTITDIHSAEKKISTKYPIIFKKCDLPVINNYMDTLSSIFTKLYDDFFGFIKYNDTVSSVIENCIICDCFESIINKLKVNNTVIDEELSILKTLKLDNYKHVFNRELMHISHSNKNKKTIDKAEKIRWELTNISGNYTEYNEEELINKVINSSLKLPKLESFLEEIKKQSESELYIINEYVDDKMQNAPKVKISINQISDSDIRRKLNFLENSIIDIDIIKKYLDSDFRLEISETDIFKLIAHDKVDYFVEGQLLNRLKVFYALINDKVFYIFKHAKKEDSFILFELDDHIIYNLINSEYEDDACNISYIECNNDHNKVVSEGIDIDSDGNIKITINPRKSYMDQYSEVHRILNEDYKNKNYEGMKHGISFMFALISIIERDKRYDNKNKNQELIKARAFAMNDFKTYLKHIQNVEPRFNFDKFYRDNNYDKTVVNISPDTLAGITKIIKSIL